MPPEGTNLVLSSNIPHGKRDVLILHGLDIEAYRGHRIKSVPGQKVDATDQL